MQGSVREFSYIFLTICKDRVCPVKRKRETEWDSKNETPSSGSGRNIYENYRKTGLLACCREKEMLFNEIKKKKK